MAAKKDSAWKVAAEKRRAKRRSLDLTLMTVSQRMGVSESTLHRYERGARKPPPNIEADWGRALFKEAK
jgi:transcriptional regulator with XRE-family HTH domain